MKFEFKQPSDLILRKRCLDRYVAVQTSGLESLVQSETWKLGPTSSMLHTKSFGSREEEI